MSRREDAFEKPSPDDWIPARGDSVWLRRTASNYVSGTVIVVAGKFMRIRHPGVERTELIAIEDARPMYSRETETDAKAQ